MRPRRRLLKAGPKPVVSEPAAASIIGTANSMTYGGCGDNPFEPPPDFQRLSDCVGSAISNVFNRAVLPEPGRHHIRGWARRDRRALPHRLPSHSRYSWSTTTLLSSPNAFALASRSYYQTRAIKSGASLEYYLHLA
jgi:hypothetical protein